jgi:type VI secretion system secreted protein Hcp
MAVNICLKLDGVTGESMIQGHTDEIDILAWSWGMSQSGTTHMGSGGGSGKVSVQDLSFTKYVDNSTPTLIKFCCNGKHIDSGKLTIMKAGGDSPVDYVTIEFQELIVTSVTSGGSGSDDRLTENVSLNFREFHYTYTKQSAEGSGSGNPDVKWDIALNAEG